MAADKVSQKQLELQAAELQEVQEVFESVGDAHPPLASPFPSGLNGIETIESEFAIESEIFLVQAQLLKAISVATMQFYGRIVFFLEISNFSVKTLPGFSPVPF